MPVSASVIGKLSPSPEVERPHCLAKKARPASSEKRLGMVVPPGMTGSRLAASMHPRSSCDQEVTADVVDPRRRTWLADSHFLDQRLKGPELSIDLAKRASGPQLEPGSE
jgi:hypothetical protein